MSQALLARKVSTRDEAVARVLQWLPWLSFFGVSSAPPLIFLVLFFFTTSTTSAAFYLFLTVLGAAIGLAAAAVLVFALLLYRKRWLRSLREKLALDGITASEVVWFQPELTTAERKTLKEIKKENPLLADAYCETLATRLMASRLMARTKKDLLLVERRINRIALIQGPDTNSLLQDLRDDRTKLENAKKEAAARMAETQARLQTIEAAASRDL